MKSLVQAKIVSVCKNLYILNPSCTLESPGEFLKILIFIPQLGLIELESLGMGLS